MGDSLLIKASEMGDDVTVWKLLTQGAYIDTRDKYGSTALMRASAHGQVDVVKMLLSSGANVDIQDYNGFTSPMRPRAMRSAGGFTTCA